MLSRIKEQKMAPMIETQVTQTGLRLLMLKQRLLSQRLQMKIDSPLAKYSNNGQLPSYMPKWNEENSSWMECVNSKVPNKNIFKHKNESSDMTLKRTRVKQESSAPSKKIKGTSTHFQASTVTNVSSNFFQRLASTTSMKTNVNQEIIEKMQEQPESLDDPNFDKGQLSKGLYDDPLSYYIKIKNEENSLELPKLHEQQNMVKFDDKLCGELADNLQILGKQGEEIKYLSNNNSGYLPHDMRKWNINASWNSKITKKKFSKRKQKSSNVTDYNLTVKINNRLKRSLAKDDSYAPSKKLRGTPVATLSGNFFQNPITSVKTNFDQETIEENQKQPESLNDPKLDNGELSKKIYDNPSLFNTIQNDKDDDSSDELPNFENINYGDLNLSGEILAETEDDISEFISISCQQQTEEIEFWTRVVDMERRRHTMKSSITSTMELMKNMEINNDVKEN